MGNMSKIKEILKKVKSGVLKLKNIDPKILKQVLKEQLKQKIIIPVVNFGITVGSWIVLGCLIIGVILLVFAGLMELFKALLGALQAFVDGVQYVFIGTAASVNTDDIDKVKEDLKNMGVDFNEIGYIGAIEKMGGADNATDYKIKLTETLKIKMAEEFTWLENTATDEEIKIHQDDRLEYYINEYLKAESQTAAAKNGLTFSDNKGAITLSHTKALKAQDSLWARFKAWITGSYDIKFTDGKFYAKVGSGSDTKQVDITKQVFQMYMPWQYPFTFHNETQSPDVGYLVAKLNKYHKLNLTLDVDEILYIKVNETDGVGEEKSGQLENILEIKWVSAESLNAELVFSGVLEKGGNAVSIIQRNPMIVVDSVTTWNSTYKYKYHYKVTAPLGDKLKYDSNGADSKFTSTSKNDILDEFELVNAKTDNAYIKYKPTGEKIADLGFKVAGWSGGDRVYYCRFTIEGENNSDIEISESRNDAGYNDMSAILLDYPTFDDKGEITNDAMVPKYYLANATEKREDGTYNGEPKPLNIKTHAEAIIQGVDEIYRTDKTSKEVLAGPKKDTAPINSDKFKEMMDTTTAFQPDMSVKMVADIVNFFNDNGVVDISTFFGNGMDGLYANMDSVWFLDDEPDNVSVTYSGDTATFTGNAGTVIYSPITGEVEDVVNGEIHLVKYGTYDEAVAEGLAPAEGETKVPLMRVIISNVSNIEVTKGAQVTAGSTRLGVISDEFDEGGTRKGKITYEHIDGAGTVVNPKEEIDKMITIETMDFALPLPAEHMRVTSYFGPRNPPAKGASNWHKGIDLAAPNGTPIYAIADGVAIAKYQNGGYGNYVVVDHGNGLTSEYGHMSDTASVAKRGGTVKKGDVIGYVGNTGASSGNHLHLTIKDSSVSRNLDGKKYTSHIDPLDEAGLNVFYGGTKSNY